MGMEGLSREDYYAGRLLLATVLLLREALHGR